MALPGNKDFNEYDNYVTDTNPTTSAQAQDYFRNQSELLKAVIDCDFWQPETVYQPGDVVKSDSMPNGTEAVMVATEASVTSNVEPQWGAVGGANISDGTCFWKLRKRLATVNGIEADAKGNVQIPVMQGSNENAGGADGLVPAPPATSNELFLSNEGEWKEAGKVKSVNGKTGDVVVGEIVDASISGTEITLTFADGTIKTLTTQDTVVAFKPDFNSLITISSLPFTAPTDCFVLIAAIRASNSSEDGQITVNGKTVIWFKNVASATLGCDTTQFWVKKGDVVNVAGRAQFYKGLYCGGRT